MRKLSTAAKIVFTGFVSLVIGPVAKGKSILVAGSNQPKDCKSSDFSRCANVEETISSILMAKDRFEINDSMNTGICEDRTRVR